MSTYLYGAFDCMLNSVNSVTNLIKYALEHYADIYIRVIGARLKPITTSASLAKRLIVHLQTKWLWVRVPLQRLKFQIHVCFEQGVP